MSAKGAPQRGHTRFTGSMRYTKVSTIPARSNTVANNTTTTSMLCGLLTHERGNPPFELGQLHRLHQDAIARHRGEPASRELGDIARQEQQALGQRRSLLLEMLVELGAVPPRHPQVGQSDLRLDPFGVSFA